MNLRLKSYIFILILSLIVLLIAGMYLELIGNAINFNYPQVSVTSNQTLSGINDDSIATFYGVPEKSYSFFMMDLFSPVSTYPPPTSADKAMYPYPAATFPTP